MKLPSVIALITAVLVAGCGGGGGDSTAATSVVQTSNAPAPVAPVAATPPVPATTAEAPVVPAPSTPSPTTCTIAAAPVYPAIERAKLSHWFSSGVAGKKIVWVGDSTTEQMGPEALHGWSGVNSYYRDKYISPVDSPLYGTTETWLGISGNTLANFNNNRPAEAGLSAAIATAGDLYIFSYGINDVRLGSTDQATLTANLETAVSAIRTALPNADIVLRMPNSLLTTDVNSWGWVVPNASAQTYTDILRNAYRSLANKWPNVAFYDSQALLFGEVSLPANVYMLDQLHPNADGYKKVYDQLVDIIGTRTAPAPQCM